MIRLSNIPAVSSLMGRGVAAGHPEQLSRSYLGLAGDPELAALVEDSDCLITLGVILSDTNLGVPVHRLDLRRVVHAFGGEVRIAHHVYPHLPLRDLVRELSNHIVSAILAPCRKLPLRGKPSRRTRCRPVPQTSPQR